MTRRRAWIGAVALAATLGALFAWSSHERRARRAGGAEAHATTEELALGARAADGGADRAARSADAGASPGLAHELAPVRLSEPAVERDPRVPGGVLAGRVLAFASNRPIPGAELTFAREGTTRSVRTDAAGAFTFAAQAAGTYVLALATADGFLPFAPEWGHSPVRFVARPGVRLEGVVIYLVDAAPYVAAVIDAEGAPVEGARVRIFGVESGERSLAPMPSTHVTDARGEARFEAPDHAIVEAVHASGRARARVDYAAQVTHRIELRLVREETPRHTGRIAGRVLGPAREPIGGAVVVARHLSRATLHPAIETTSDGDGRFVLEPADEGAYRVEARASGYGRAARAPVTIGTDVEIALGPESSLRVRVVDGETGAPVAAATVVVMRARGPLARETVAVESSYDAEGEITLGGLPDGTFAVHAVAPGYASSDPADVTLRASATSQVVLRLGRGGRIEGRVAGSDDRPLRGARVTLEGHVGEGASAVPLEINVLTDADGRFTLAGVRPGRWSIVIVATEHHARVRSGIDVREGAATDVGTVDLAPLEEGERPGLELAGIGAVLAAEGDAMVVGRTLEGGGAAEVGLVPGDAILEVEGVPVVALGFGGTIERIRGPEGTLVRLRVRRADGRLELLDVPRRRIRAR